MRFMMMNETGNKSNKDVMSTSTGEMVASVMEIVENPPETWEPYLSKKDYRGIYEMESEELSQVFRESMEGKASMKAVVKEIRHTFAAMLLWQAHKTEK